MIDTPVPQKQPDKPAAAPPLANPVKKDNKTADNNVSQGTPPAAENKAKAANSANTNNVNVPKKEDVDPLSLIEDTGKPDVPPAVQNTQEFLDTGKAEEPAVQDNRNSQTEPQNTETAQTPKYDKSTEVDEIMNLMSHKEAVEVKIDCGIHKGKTLGELADSKPESLKWYYTQYTGKNNILRAGARIISEQITKIA
jgi:hypothetical protein